MTTLDLNTKNILAFEYLQMNKFIYHNGLFSFFWHFYISVLIPEKISNIETR